MSMLKVATVCSGVGSPEIAIKNLGIKHEITFACEIDKYARETYLANYEPETMYTDMTAESWKGSKYYADLFIGGIPCQSFSLAGKRLGELDPRGLLFFDFLRYVKNQNPKYFIIENVKGLLSDNNGETFRNWIQLLGQSVNGDPFMFPHEDSLMYNLHWQVLNTKDYGLPQNRERVFLIGIRNDLPNDFVFPKGIPLKLRLKDILEDEVDEKYYLSEKTVATLERHGNKIIENNTPKVSCCIHANYFKMGGRDQQYLKVKSATKSGYEIATEGDSINLSNINSETRRGRVGKQVAQTLEINENGTSNCLSTVQKDNLVVESTTNPKRLGNIYGEHRGTGFAGNVWDKEAICPTLTTMEGGNRQPMITNNFRIRKLTVTECFRLQGFPDDFKKPVSNSQLYRQAGNTISVNVIEAILKNLLKSHK